MIRIFAVLLVIFMTGCGTDFAQKPFDTVEVSSGTAPQTATNAQRAANGRGPVMRVATLDAMARAHAEDLQRNNLFSHRGSDGSGLGLRAGRVGYRFCFIAENIAKGQFNLNDVMAGWMASPGHRRNLLDSRATQLGFAQAGNVWVMVLGAPGC